MWSGMKCPKLRVHDLLIDSTYHKNEWSVNKLYIINWFLCYFLSQASRGRLKEDEARKYFQQLINAVDYCHSRGVFHRDLKVWFLLFFSYLFTYNTLIMFELLNPARSKTFQNWLTWSLITVIERREMSDGLGTKLVSFEMSWTSLALAQISRVWLYFTLNFIYAVGGNELIFMYNWMTLHLL